MLRVTHNRPPWLIGVSVLFMGLCAWYSGLGGTSSTSPANVGIYLLASLPRFNANSLAHCFANYS